MKTATSLVAVDRLDKGGCGFYTGYENRYQAGCFWLRLVAVGCGFHTRPLLYAFAYVVWLDSFFKSKCQNLSKSYDFSKRENAR